MKPYYEEKGIVIYNADCREVLPLLPRVDLVLTDPPYGLKWGKPGYQKQMKVDWQSASEWDTRPDDELFRLIKSAGKEWIIWGGNYFASGLGDCRAPLVWDKQTKDNNWADGEMAFTSLSTGTLRIFTHQWCGYVRASENGQRNYHPTQKPVALMKWCLGFVPKAETVLDPFLGSGTTLKAAKELGRKAIGIEIDEKYCEIAARRLSQGVLEFA